ncbi:glycerophosphodiester phosphodiesterase [Halosegnis longus]|nr:MULTISPECIES: glycerophosphodiester phosphodiesterase [Halobacteriales]
MRLIAHRGFAATAPENTISAIERASRRADEVTIDVRRCDSGELVAIHDPTVDRVTDGTGAVCRHTLSELQSLTVLGEEQIPTLDAALQAVPPSVGVTLDLHEIGLAHDALRLADRADVHVTVSSGIAHELEGCRGIAPEVPRAYRFDGDAEVGLEFARETDCAYLNPTVETCDGWLVATAHNEGFCVNAWGVGCQDDAAALESWGVDGVVADHPRIMPQARL